jgi:hypothetical protein
MIHKRLRYLSYPLYPIFEKNAKQVDKCIEKSACQLYDSEVKSDKNLLISISIIDYKYKFFV